MMDVDDFKRALSAAGFRGYVSVIPNGFTVELAREDFNYRQLAKLAEMIKTQDIRVQSRGWLEVTWPVGMRF